MERTNARDTNGCGKTQDRDRRQELSRRLWIENKCIGTIEACTGFGKTRVAINCIHSILKYYPDIKILIIVPTETLRQQWINTVDFACDVKIVNTVVKHHYTCDLVVVDEIHRMASDIFKAIFNVVKYNYILGLTATFERLDNKQCIIEQYCPVIDSITTEDALHNKWISDYQEYLVLLDVDDIDTYINTTREFLSHFEFFNYDFDLAMRCIGPKGYITRAKIKGSTPHAFGFIRALQKRKSFIYNHKQKLIAARQIIKARKDKKIITFSHNVKMAKAIGIGYNYTGKMTKTDEKTILEKFKADNAGVLNTCMKANEGLDVEDLSVAIVLGLDSSKLKAIQRRGRTVRFKPNKQAEIFNLVINNTVEIEWYRKSHDDDNVIILDEQNLYKMLNSEVYDTYTKPLSQFTFRY